TKTKEIITTLNRIRKENEALQSNWNIEFCDTDNELILCYSKISEDNSNKLLIVVSLDPYHSQSGWLKVPLKKFGLQENEPFSVYDLLTDSKYFWENEWNFVALHPHAIP